MIQYLVVSPGEWMYPDVAEYASARDFIHIHGPRGGYASAQILLRGTAAGDQIRVRTQGMPSEPECCRLVAVHVGENTGLKVTNGVIDRSRVKNVTRIAPYRVYEALQPFSEGGNTAEQDVTALYISFPLAASAAPGIYKGDVRIDIGEESIQIPAEVTVHKATVPAEGKMEIANWITFGAMTHFGIDAMYSDAWFRCLRQNLELQKRYRSTVLLIDLRLKVIGIEKRGDRYVFDFSLIERIIQTAEGAGLTRIEFGHLLLKTYNRYTDDDIYLFYQPDDRRIPVNSPEGMDFLNQFLASWAQFLDGHGWMESALQHICDEPLPEMAKTYHTVSAMVRKYLPTARILEAVFHEEAVKALRGAIDIWIPISDTYQKMQDVFAQYCGKDDEIWFYTCLGPSGKWLNRMLDMELLRVRLLHYGNYRFNLKGYLHWGWGCWTSDDPIENTALICDDGNNFLPPGDTHITYFRNGGNVWASMRLESMRMGIEECELLWLLEKENKELADKLCRNVLRGFDDYELDVGRFEENYIALLNAADILF